MDPKSTSSAFNTLSLVGSVNCPQDPIVYHDVLESGCQGGLKRAYWSAAAYLYKEQLPILDPQSSIPNPWDQGFKGPSIALLGLN